MLEKLKRLKVIAYSDSAFNHKICDGEAFTSMNLEKYIYHYEIIINKNQSYILDVATSTLARKSFKDMEFDFIFDQSGAISKCQNPSNNLIGDIERFKKIILNYNGITHKANYIIISWGTLFFKGILTEINVEFELFKPDGTPIRAIAKTKFKGYAEDNLCCSPY